MMLYEPSAELAAGTLSPVDFIGRLVDGSFIEVHARTSDDADQKTRSFFASLFQERERNDDDRKYDEEKNNDEAKPETVSHLRRAESSEGRAAQYR
jgi:hypothetical protein